MNFTEVKRKQMDYICMMAVIIVVWFFHGRIGNYGMGYLTGTALPLLLVWIVIGAGSADSIGKMIRSRKSRGQYRNIEKLSKNLLVFQGVIGFFGSLSLLVLAPFLADKLVCIPFCALLIQLVSPFIFLHSLVSVLKGTLQGENEEKLVVIASWIRVVLFFIFGLLFEKGLKNYGDKVSALLRQEHFSAMYGGAGVILGLLFAEVFVLIFMLFSGRKFLRKRRRDDADGKKATESPTAHVKNMLSGRAMSFGLGLLEILPFLIGNYVLIKKGQSLSEAIMSLGDFVSLVVNVIGFFLLPILAFAIPIFVKTVGSMKRTERRVARNHFQCGYHFCFALGIFGTCFTCVMSPVFQTMFLTENEKIQKSFVIAGVLVLGITLYYYLSRLLMRLGWQIIILGCVTICDVIFCFMFAICMKGVNPYQGFLISIIAAIVVFVVVMSVFSFSQFRVGTDAIIQILVSTGVAGVIGLIDLLLVKLVSPHLSGWIVAGFSFVGSFLIYWFVLVISKNVKEYELGIAPGGKILKKIGELLRVF